MEIACNLALACSQTIPATATSCSLGFLFGRNGLSKRGSGIQTKGKNRSDFDHSNFKHVRAPKSRGLRSFVTMAISV